MWDISYLNLLMLMYDQQSTLYDFDSKRNGKTNYQQRVNGDDKTEMENFIKQMKDAGFKN